MLDVHAITGTPGAATVLGVAFPTVCSGDGATVAGVPIGSGAILVLHGLMTVTANTIGAYKMWAQDMVDPVNGEYLTPGAASLLNQFFKFDKLSYKTGGRNIQAGTNTGVGAAIGILIDAYSGGPVQEGSYCPEQSAITNITTFGGALTTLVWGSQAYAPASPLPNGKYMILGAWVSAIANAALIRFQHSDFGAYLPGFPVHNYETISTSTWDKLMKNDLVMTQQGYQFVYLSDILGIPCCPVFTVGNGVTGLNIQMLSVQADTPVVTLNLVKVG